MAVYSLDVKARLTVAVGDEMIDYTARSTYGDMWDSSSQGNHGQKSDASYVKKELEDK